MKTPRQCVVAACELQEASPCVAQSSREWTRGHLFTQMHPEADQGRLQRLAHAIEHLQLMVVCGEAKLPGDGHLHIGSFDQAHRHAQFVVTGPGRGRGQVARGITQIGLGDDAKTQPAAAVAGQLGLGLDIQRRFGALSPELEQRIATFLDFSSVADLEDWLRSPGVLTDQD